MKKYTPILLCVLVLVALFLEGQYHKTLCKSTRGQSEDPSPFQRQRLMQG